jgi:hypothetical protein
MGFEGTSAISRRAVAWDPVAGVLTVGARAVTLTCGEGDNECVLRTYLHLVAEQRAVELDRRVVLRRDDIRVLAELLDLDDVGLERLLASLLRLSDREARDLRRELLRQRVTVAAFGVGLAATLPLTAVAADEPTPPVPNAAVTDHTALAADSARPHLTAVPAETAITVEAPTTTATYPTTAAPTTAAVPASSPPTVAPASAEPPAPEPDEVEIGYSVTYERDPDFVAPEGVDIGDAMVLERDLPGE